MTNEHEYKKISISEIKPYARNARTHSTEQVKQIMDAIKEWGFTNPLLIDEQNNLIAGHGRLEAVKQLNKVDFKDKPILELPAIVVKGLDESQKKALIIADNQIALNAGWDYEVLQSELKELENLNYDLDLLAFDNVDELLREVIDENVNGGQEIDTGNYTTKVATPIYEIKGDEPVIEELLDTTKAEKLINKIKCSRLGKAKKDFLINCAYRFLDFNFAKIAEFYAHQDKETQELMEELALVIIDYDKAIELGYIELVDYIENITKGERK